MTSLANLDMPQNPIEVGVGRSIEELPKSRLPAGAATDDGQFPFFRSSPEVSRTDMWTAEGETVLLGTGGLASVHLGQGRFSYSADT